VVICLGRGADLHMAQLMLLPLTVSCSSKSRLFLLFWYCLTRVVPDIVQRGRKMVVVVAVAAAAAAAAVLNTYWVLLCEQQEFSDQFAFVCTVSACMCAFVPGTGCNAAYVEKVDNVDKWTGPKDGSPTVRILFCIMYLLTKCCNLMLR